MKKYLHTGLISFKRLFIFFLVAGACTLAFSFDLPDQTSPSAQVIKCYPNPATSFVNFEFPKNIDKSNTLLVFSFVGKKMTEVPVNNNKMTLTLNDYYRGVYVYQLRDKGGNIVESGKFSVIK